MVAGPVPFVSWASWYTLNHAISLQVAKRVGFISGVYLMELEAGSRPLSVMNQAVANDGRIVVSETMKPALVAPSVLVPAVQHFQGWEAEGLVFAPQ